MATLEHRETGTSLAMPSRLLVGRAEGAGLVLVDNGVSGEHASVFWDGKDWLLRDLGSRNGTWLNDRRLPPGKAHQLRTGSVVRFGVDDQTWTVLDVSPPNGNAVAAPVLPQTQDVALGVVLENATLRVAVSSDQEFVQVTLLSGTSSTRLADRTYHDLFHILGQARMQSRGTCSPAEEGWVYFDDLCKMLGRSPKRVNVEIFRARQQLTEIGVEDAVNAFERRAPTRQIRIGFTQVDIREL